MSHTQLQPDLSSSVLGAGRWMVTIYDNDHTAREEVVTTLMMATGCCIQEAVIETWEAEQFGKTPVHFADKARCEEVATIISSIGVKAVVEREWED